MRALSIGAALVLVPTVLYLYGFVGNQRDYWHSRYANELLDLGESFSGYARNVPRLVPFLATLSKDEADEALGCVPTAAPEEADSQDVASDPCTWTFALLREVAARRSVVDALRPLEEERLARWRELRTALTPEEDSAELPAPLVADNEILGRELAQVSAALGLFKQAASELRAAEQAAISRKSDLDAITSRLEQGIKRAERDRKPGDLAEPYRDVRFEIGQGTFVDDCPASPRFRIERVEGDTHLVADICPIAGLQGLPAFFRATIAFPIGDFVAPGQTGFDAVVLVDEQGHSIAQRSSDVSRLRHLSDLRHDAPRGEVEQPEESGLWATLSALWGAEARGLERRWHAGREYFVFEEAVRLDIPLAGEVEAPPWRLVGLVDVDRFDAQVRRLPLPVLIVALYVLLGVLLGVPVLRIWLVESTHGATRVEIGVLAMSVLFLVSLTIVGMLQIAQKLEIDRDLDVALEEMSEDLITDFVGELEARVHQLEEMSREEHRDADFQAFVDRAGRSDFDPSANYLPVQTLMKRAYSSVEGDVSERLAARCRLANPDASSRFSRMIWADRQGWAFSWINCLNTPATLLPSLVPRAYFQAALGGSTWVREAGTGSPDASDVGSLEDAVFIERILSWRDGVKQTVVSSGAALPGEGDHKRFAQISFGHLATFEHFAPGAGFGFAVIEPRNGGVLYHSAESRSLFEDFFLETDENRAVRGMIRERRSGLSAARYHGRDHRFFIAPLPQTPWSLVTFVSEAPTDSLLFETFVLSALHLGTFSLCALLFMALAGVFRRRARWWWLWPDERLGGIYRRGLFFLFLLGLASVGIAYVHPNASWDGQNQLAVLIRVAAAGGIPAAFAMAASGTIFCAHQLAWRRAARVALPARRRWMFAAMAALAIIGFADLLRSAYLAMATHFWSGAPFAILLVCSGAAGALLIAGSVGRDRVLSWAIKRLDLEGTWGRVRTSRLLHWEVQFKLLLCVAVLAAGSVPAVAIFRDSRQLTVEKLLRWSRTETSRQIADVVGRQLEENARTLAPPIPLGVACDAAKAGAGVDRSRCPRDAFGRRMMHVVPLDGLDVSRARFEDRREAISEAHFSRVLARLLPAYDDESERINPHVLAPDRIPTSTTSRRAWCVDTIGDESGRGCDGGSLPTAASASMKTEIIAAATAGAPIAISGFFVLLPTVVLCYALVAWLASRMLGSSVPAPVIPMRRTNLYDVSSRFDLEARFGSYLQAPGWEPLYVDLGRIGQADVDSLRTRCHAAEVVVFENLDRGWQFDTLPHDLHEILSARSAPVVAFFVSASEDGVARTLPNGAPIDETPHRFRQLFRATPRDIERERFRLELSGFGANGVEELVPSRAAEKGAIQFEGEPDLFILRDLEVWILNPMLRETLLRFLERMVYSTTKSRAVVLAGACPVLPLLHNPNRDGPPIDNGELIRWTRVLGAFERIWPCFDAMQGDGSDPESAPAQIEAERLAWPELAPVLDRVEREWRQADVVRNGQGGDASSDVEQIVMRTAEHAEATFRAIWSACTPAEQLVLHRLACGELANAKDPTLLRGLLSRGLVRRAPDFQLASRSFEWFVSGAERRRTILAWEQLIEGDSVWKEVRLPLVAVLGVAAIFLVSAGGEAVRTGLALFSGGAASVPALLDIISSRRSGRADAR